LVPILVTEFGIVILVKLLHPENAHSPILITESGIVILVKFVAFWNIAAPIIVTDSGMVYAVLPGGNAISAVNVALNNTPSVLANVVLDGSANMFCKALQPVNTCVPIVATEAGIVILVKAQPKNAMSPMLVSELGLSKTTLAKPVQL
jgi:hypothetical protein